MEDNRMRIFYHLNKDGHKDQMWISPVDHPEVLGMVEGKELSDEECFNLTHINIVFKPVVKEEVVEEEVEVEFKRGRGRPKK